MAETVVYVAIALGVGVLAFSAFSFLQPAAAAAPPAALAQSPPSPALSAQPVGIAADCGDLTDPQNVQHLSHHPAKYAECLKRIDPQVLKSATGKTLDQILG